MLNSRFDVLSENDVVKVPFGPSIPWKEFALAYPTVEGEMDGTCAENCLLFYYTLNPVNMTYELRDDDAENDFADVIGLDLFNISTGETRTEESLRKEEFPINEHCYSEENINVRPDFAISECSVSKNKAIKKERRKQKVLARGGYIEENKFAKQDVQYGKTN
jgi:hypothetical protein